MITDTATIIFEGEARVLLKISWYCLVILTPAEFAYSKRGKHWRRAKAM